MRQLAKSSMVLFGAFTLAKVFGALRSVVIARILDPATYGTWSVFMLILVYGQIAHFGTLEALVKEYAYQDGKGDREAAKAIETAALGSVVLFGSLALVLGAFFEIFIRATAPQSVMTYVKYMIIALAVGLLSLFQQQRFVARQRFTIVSIVESLRGLLGFFIYICFGWFWKMPGLVFAALATEVLICLVTTRVSYKEFGRIGISIDFNRIWQLIRIGFPITIVLWLFALQSSVDRVISMTMLGDTATGYYSLGLQLVGVIYLIPTAVAKVLYPKVNEIAGKTGKMEDLSSFVVRPSVYVGLIVGFIVAAVLLFLPFIYQVFLPKYAPGMPSAEILLGSVGFGALCVNGVNFIIARNKSGLLLRYVAISLVLNVGAGILLVNAGTGIEGVAASTTLSSILLTTLVWRRILKDFEYTRRQMATMIARLYFPSVSLFALLFSIRGVMRSVPGAPGYISGFVSVGLYCVILLNMPYYKGVVRDILVTLGMKKVRFT